MKKVCFIIIFFVIIALAPGCISNPQPENKESATPFNLNLRLGENEEEQVFEVTKALFKKEGDDSVVVFLTNNNNINCEDLYTTEYKEGDITVRFNLFHKNKQKLATGAYTRDGEFSMGPEIITFQKGYLFGSDPGSIEISQLDFASGRIEGSLFLRDTYDLQVDGKFVALECRD
ncbi:hypothetical protein KKC60_03195 [Patescibacteria group bacterium]|nr:hypothetical protein [Patescibacteria group bacterium]